jgi:hypothetical protein
LQSLCGQVRKMSPSDFVWLTDEARMSSQDVHANIWARGGQLDSPLQSILGNEMRDVPGEDPYQKK